MATKVMRNDMGSATMGMRVSVARPRKTKMTRITRTKAIRSVAWTSCSELTIDWERSNTGINRMDPGNSRCNPGKSSRTERATSTALAPAWRETAKTITEAGGWKLRTKKCRDKRSFSTPSTTRATSRR